MDTFMDHITETMKGDGAVAVNVFPSDSYVVLSYADRVAQEVVITSSRSKLLLLTSS